ncbi:unnamed protein product [Schistosoma margrebowiei]|uniref:Uncharacterized protein n=2 Tax=Schistosoma margrebowiei TaxID=48269 RepID=A0AA85AJE7_9TREM|nr:unnamed protein product [Schistosoma margrebowiei]
MESTEVNCSENSAVQENTTTITITSTTTVNNITTDKTTEDHYDYHDNQTEVLTKTIHSDLCNSNDLQSSIHSHETNASELKVDDHETENPQNLNKTNVITTGIMIIRNETTSPHIDTFNNEVISMNTDVSTENIDEIEMKQDKTHKETSQQLQENNLENNQDIKTEVELSLTKHSSDISIHKSSISNHSSINQSIEHYITTQEESIVNNDKDNEKNSPKHPYRPPPPKLNQTKHTSISLSYSGGENDDVISKNDKLNDNSQIDTTNNNNYETNVQTSLKQQQNENDLDQHKPQYKRPTIKSNIKHVFTNLRKSFKRKDKPSIKHVVNDHDNVENNHTYTTQQPMTTHAYYNNNNNNDYIDHRSRQSNFPSSSSSHQEYHHQYYRNSNEIQENQSQLSNAQSLNISITDSLQQLKRPEEDIDIIYSTEIIAPPAIPTKMSSDPNNPIYVNHSIKPNRPPTIDRKETDAKEFAASAIVDSVVSNRETYWKDELNSRDTTNQPLNVNYQQYYLTRSEQSTPHLSIRSQSYPTNNYHEQKKLYLTSDFLSTQHQLSSQKPTRPSNPPLLSPMDHHQRQDKLDEKNQIGIRRLDLMNSINPGDKFTDYDHGHFNNTVGYYNTEPLSIQYQPNHSYTMRSDRRIVSPGSLDRRYPQEYDQYYSSPEARRVQTMRYTDYPTRPRIYQPTYQAATLSFNEFDHHYNNGGTLKPRKPKIITERYKCSEVYNWPPKFPKLKRHKTNPPKQIHTAQDHIVIKQQLKTTAGNNYSPTIQQTESNTEQIHCTKINNQYQLPNCKRELSISPERQVTSLHSLQRSTLLEKSNRTPGTETRDQLFIADYKLTPNNQIGSTKPDALALPYFAKMTENKRFSKFHYNNTTTTNHNNNNNITMSSEVMRSDSPKSLASLIDALKMIHPLLYNLNENYIPLSLTDHDDNNNNSKLFIHCLSEYLFTCMKLRSLDLKGEFVTFLFPLKHFNEQLWNKYGTIDDWNELSIVCEPNTNYEYVVLNTANESSQKIRFPTKTIDKLLTNWLDNQTTKSPSSGNRHSFESKNNTEKHSDDKLLHSISLAVTLKTLLNLFKKHEKVESDEHHPHQEQEQQQQEQQPCIDLFLTCIKLSVLLSLSECLDKNQSIQLNLTPEHILLILTPSNCLTIFKHYEKIQNNKQNEKSANTDNDDNNNHNETHDLQSLLRIMNIQYDTIHESINDLIKQLYEIIQHKYQYSDMITSLLKSVAPPDWITMCVARICLYNQTNT